MNPFPTRRGDARWRNRAATIVWRVIAALTVESAKMIAIAVAVGLLLISFLVFKVIKEVTTKAILLLVIGGLILGMWSQRTQLNDCGKKVVENVKLSGPTAQTTCSFFGFDATVKIPTSVPGG
jgi:hypothetical protein